MQNRTAAARYQPGQYKADRDFVLDKTREIRKDVWARFERAPSTTFVPMERTDSDGILRGIRNPGNMILYHNTTGPGQYETNIDGTESPAKVRWMSVPAWTQRRGEPQETVRAKRQSKSTPGPGHYVTPTRFDAVNKQREVEFQRIVRRDQATRRDQAEVYASIFGSVRAAGAAGALGRRPAELPDIQLKLL